MAVFINPGFQPGVVSLLAVRHAGFAQVLPASSHACIFLVALSGHDAEDIQDT